jgi:hypothetical protein
MSEHSEFSPLESKYSIPFIKNNIVDIVNVVNSVNSVNSVNNIELAQCQDSIVRSVVASFLERSKVGQLKYGTNLDRTDLTTMQWIQHAQEELMDGILYLEKLKHTLSLEKK